MQRKHTLRARGRLPGGGDERRGEVAYSAWDAPREPAAPNTRGELSKIRADAPSKGRLPDVRRSGPGSGHGLRPPWRGALTGVPSMPPTRQWIARCSAPPCDADIRGCSGSGPRSRRWPSLEGARRAKSKEMALARSTRSADHSDNPSHAPFSGRTLSQVPMSCLRLRQLALFRVISKTCHASDCRGSAASQRRLGRKACAWQHKPGQQADA